MNFVFKITSLYPRWWIIPKQSTFFLKWTNIKEKKFLQKMISVFYHRSSVTSLITMSFKEDGHKKNSWKISSIPCIPLIYNTQSLNSFCGNDYLGKKHSLKHHSSFSLSVLCTTSESIVIQKNFHAKSFR